MDSKERSAAIVEAQARLKERILDASTELHELERLVEEDNHANGYDNGAVTRELRGGLALIYRALAGDIDNWHGYNRARQRA